MNEQKQKRLEEIEKHHREMWRMLRQEPDLDIMFVLNELHLAWRQNEKMKKALTKLSDFGTSPYRTMGSFESIIGDVAREALASLDEETE